MNSYAGIYRLTNQKLEVAKERALYDRAAATAIREPLPNTFLGRQHYDLMPLPDQIELVPSIGVNSIKATQDRADRGWTGGLDRVQPRLSDNGHREDLH